MRELILKDIKHAHYLTGWKLFIWRIFIKKVYPDWEKGHYHHIKLIEDGAIAHADEPKSGEEYCCEIPPIYN